AHLKPPLHYFCVGTRSLVVQRGVVRLVAAESDVLALDAGAAKCFDAMSRRIERVVRCEDVVVRQTLLRRNLRALGGGAFGRTFIHHRYRSFSQQLSVANLTAGLSERDSGFRFDNNGACYIGAAMPDETPPVIPQISKTSPDDAGKKALHEGNRLSWNEATRA